MILDRDGVINQESEEYVRSASELKILDGVPEAIASLTKLGCVVVVATNQSGVARHFFSEETLGLMFDKIQARVQECGGAISHFYYCPHGPMDRCDCRKPLPGMLDTAVASFDADQSISWMVGDSVRDIHAGRAADLNVALVRTGNGAQTELLWHEDWGAEPPVYDSLPLRLLQCWAIK